MFNKHTYSVQHTPILYAIDAERRRLTINARKTSIKHMNIETMSET